MKQIEKLLRWLNAADVRYVIIGATAFAAHGWVRATADLDLFIDSAEANVSRLRATLTEFGYDVSEATEEDFARFKILLRQYELPLDLHPFVAGDLPFAEVWKRRIVAKIGDVEAPFACLDDIIPSRPRLSHAKHLLTFRAEYGDRAHAALLLHTGSALQWLAPDVLAAPWWRVL